MVKDTTVDRHPRLKRTDSKTDNSTKLSVTDNGNFYQKLTEFEEHEALSRDGDKDLKLFTDICEKFRHIIKKVGELKAKNGKEHSSAIAEGRVDGSVLFVKMKKLNRLEKYRLNNAREKLYETKRQVDNFHLQWQNLLYETHHLKKEISKCLSFKSKDEHIELIPVDEFYSSAPQNISRMEVTKNDAHQLRLARLEWELSQRKLLAETCNNLEEEKEKILREIKRKKDRIDNLVPMIKNILAVTKPVQEHLGLPISQIQNEPEWAQLLPPPLYFLSIQIDAMREACDQLIKLSIDGDKEVAVRFNNNISELTTIEESDSEDEAAKNHHHRRKTKTQIREEKVKKLFMKHPLSVTVELSLKEENKSIAVRFTYLINLRIITVSCVVKFDTVYTGVCCRHLLESRNILNGLFEQDYGDESPNSANNYQLQQLGVEFNTSELGIPYLWAQKLCGLNFTGRASCNEKVDAKTNAEQRNLSSTVKQIRNHLKTKLELCEQIQELEKLILPCQNQALITVPVNISCTLTKWELLPWDKFVEDDARNHLIYLFNLTEHDNLFQAIFVRDKAKLTADVIVKPNYPDSPPIYSILIENEGMKHTAQNNNNVRDVEKEVNLYVDELFEKLENKKNWILAAQLYKLAMCFDIFLECTDSENFPRQKLFSFHVKGRTRSLPFKFVKQGNEGVFVQR